MKKPIIRGELPKGIEMVLIPRTQFEKMFQEKSALKLSKEDINMSELISSVAIEIWRLGKRIEISKHEFSNGSGKDTNPVIDQVQRIRDVFKKQDIEIRDHTGAYYNDGLSLKVLHVEETENIPKGKMQIIETVKPSVYYKSQVIFHGEVIVGKSKEK